VPRGNLPSTSGLGNQTVESFQIGRCEVTWGEWKSVRDWAVSNKGYDLAGVGETVPAGSADNFPVVNVNWFEVLKWCNAKSEKEGKTPFYRNGDGTIYKAGNAAPAGDASADGYRLPSEKEWELAARGGGTSLNYTYSGSNAASEVAWTIESSSNNGSKAVGTKLPNQLGIYDMSGNACEWCWDGIRGGAGSCPPQRRLLPTAEPPTSFRPADTPTSDSVWPAPSRLWLWCKAEGYRAHLGWGTKP